jgi:D-glycero-alpha-D-manno-heptose-7-phosphate kinase
MKYVCKAPLRIGLAGGGTDVSPYSDNFGGAILNVTINLFATVTIIPRDDNKVIINALNQGIKIELEAKKELEIHPKLKIQIGVYNRFVKDYMKKPIGCEIISTMDCPTGSGLGTSSTMVVATIGAFAEWLNIPFGEYDMAQLAYSIEREDLAMTGGKQDQYAATFGGMNFMEFFKGNHVIVNPLRMRERTLEELEFHLLLFHTRTIRESSSIIDRQKENFSNNESVALNATHKLKADAFKMKEALLKSEINEVGKILENSWKNKKQLAKGISNDQIDHIYSTAINAGASGGKVSGAGGGGFMIFYCPGVKKYDVIKALEEIGAQYQRFNFYQKGVHSWPSNQ